MGVASPDVPGREPYVSLLVDLVTVLKKSGSSTTFGVLDMTRRE